MTSTSSALALDLLSDRLLRAPVTPRRDTREHPLQSVGIGLGVLAELMEEEVVEVVGTKGKHHPDRVAVRHGHEPGEVTLGGRRVGIERPRVRSADGASELPLATYRYFADRDPLTRLVLDLPRR